MGQAILCYEVMPKGVEEVDKVEAGLKKMNPNKVQKKPLAFGLSVFEVNFVVDDKVGMDTDKLEKSLEKIKGVGSVRSIGVTLA